MQRILQEERIEGTRLDALLLVEHEPIFTLGRRTKDEHWKGNAERIKNSALEVLRVERGGSVTYHGPGQLVGYPILMMRNFCAGPKAYVEMLQEVIIRVLADWEIQGCLRPKFPGVWVEGDRGSLQKIAAVGVRITRGVTLHGWGLNVDMDLKPFELITPCGIEGCKPTSMASLLEKPVDRLHVRGRFAYHFGEVFGLDWIERWTVLPKFDSTATFMASSV